MKAPAWHQCVLVLSDEKDLITQVLSRFSAESQLFNAATPKEAIELLEKNKVDVLIIDQKATHLEGADKGSEDAVSYLELVQYAKLMNANVMVTILINKMLNAEAKFAQKCGATLVMDRKSVSPDPIVYLTRVLRKRTFRTVLWRDMPIGFISPVTLYHYVPHSDKYLPFLIEGDAFDSNKMSKLMIGNVRHLFTLGKDFPTFLQGVGDSSRTEKLHDAREKFKGLLIEIFDLGSDGILSVGLHLQVVAKEIIETLKQLVDSYENTQECLDELPYPRWSAMAHVMNGAIYSLVFSRICKIDQREEVAMAALVHNLGLAKINQEVLRKKEKDFSPEEKKEYVRHVAESVDLLKTKLFPLTPLMESILMNHHECLDGSGFPLGRSGLAIPCEATFVSLLSSFDYFHSVRPGETTRSPKAAWDDFKKYHGGMTSMNAKFHSKILEPLNQFFEQS